MEDKAFYFRQIMFEILVRHPSEDAEQAAGYTSPESGDKSGLKMSACGGLENHLDGDLFKMEIPRPLPPVIQ